MSPKTKRVPKRPRAKSKSTRDSSKPARGVRYDDSDPLGFKWVPGAPSKYDSRFCQEIIISARKGETFLHFASDRGVTTDTLLEWARKHKEFSVARQRAKQEAELYMLNLGQTHMLGKAIGEDIEEYEDARGRKKKRKKVRFLSPSMWQFFMKCRFGYREDTPVLGDDDDNDLEFQYEDE